MISAIKNPMIIPDDVQRDSTTLETQKLPAQMQFLLNETKENSFTPIFTANKQFVALFVQKKQGSSALGFESVKANEAMEDLEFFFSILQNSDAKLIGGKLPKKELYYKSN